MGQKTFFFFLLNYKLSVASCVWGLTLPKSTLPDMWRHSCINKCQSPAFVRTVCTSPDSSQPRHIRRAQWELWQSRCEDRTATITNPAAHSLMPAPGQATHLENVSLWNPRNCPRGRDCYSHFAGEEAEAGHG